MKSRTRVLILCLLCVVCASKVLSKEITEFGDRISIQDEGLSRKRNFTRESDEADRPEAGRLRDKRALGLLLSGLAQIFGYTVTPIQLASLPNPNMTRPAAKPNSTAMANVTMGQLTASSRPMSTNTTASKQQQETIRFTGVVNFGNNSDIIGHLQRYEQMFHGPRNSTRPTTMTTTRPATSMPKPAEDFSELDLRTNSPTRPPLLTPFFVKIPLPIAPELLPATTPLEDLNLSYPVPLITIASESSEEEPPTTPVRKEQETVYRNNEDTERYTVEDKEIYDEKDVMKPASKYTHQLYVDEQPNFSKQQDERYNEVQRKQEGHVARIKEQEAQRNRDQDDYDEREDEINARHRNREEEISNRNRDHASKYSSSEEKRPAYDDEENEESAEKYEERMDQANRSNESLERPAEKDERERTESYPDYDSDESDKQSGGYKQEDDQPQPVDLQKYIQVAYNQQLPIGDYFHESNPEEIRDSYGEVLNNKKLEDDRLSGYFSMFKQPYVDEINYQQAQNPEDASQEDKRKETSEENGYNEHLKRVQKLREEYALPAPENKYEEYDINDEGEADRNGRQENERDENRTAAKSKKTKTERVRGKEDVRAKTTSGSSKNQLQRESEEEEEAKSQEELNLVKYTPLIVPIRYVDASDRVEQASTRQLKYEKSEKKSDDSQVPLANVDLAIKEKPTPQVASLPERPRQLHEGEHKEFQLWPPPFDYAFDNTERTNTIVPANPQHYYQNIVTNIADNDENNDNSSEQPAGYLVVVGNPVHPYQYPPTNIYYFPKEALSSQNQALNAEGTHPQRQLYVPQQNANQQPVQVNPDPTEYNYNDTTKNPRDYYYQSQESPADVYNRYRYSFGEYASESGELPNVDMRNQISNTENWSNRIYPSQSRGNKVVIQPPSTITKLQNVASLNQNTQSLPSERQRYPQQSRKRKSSRTENQRQDDGKAKTPPRHSVPKRKPFHDPQSAHDFFGFSKNDYSFDGESGNTSKVAEENGKNTKESRVFVTPEPAAYHHDESTVKHTDEPENDTEKAVVREYRNRMATLKVSEQRRTRPNGPIHYVDFTRNI